MNTNKSTYWILFLLIISFSSCYEEVMIVPEIDGFDEKKIMFDCTVAAYDRQENFVLCPVDTSEMDNYQVYVSSITKQMQSINSKPVIKGEPYHFGTVRTNEQYKISWKKNAVVKEADLYFTTLPVVQIITNESIPDEPKIGASVVISDPSNDMPGTYSYAGIEMRGSKAMLYPKKSYSLELWEYEGYGYSSQLSLLNMKAHNEWILDAMFIDNARMRNRASFDVWKMITGSRNIEEKEAQVKTYIEGNFVEVFLNGSYQGVYALNERFDRKRMGVSFSEESLEGLIFKAEAWTGPTKYIGMADKPGGEYWAGWELKYPKDYGDGVWQPFYEYLEFCMQSPDETFKKNIRNNLSLTNAIDYYLFMNLIQAFDNSGKNIIMARYDNQSPFLITPWDLDATWGRNWDGTFLGHHHILSNALFDRLMELDPEDFNQRLENRWDELQEDNLENRIMEIFDRYNHLLVSSGALTREKDRWPQSELNMEREMEYIEEWTGKRIDFLDNHFD